MGTFVPFVYRYVMYLSSVTPSLEVYKVGSVWNTDTLGVLSVCNPVILCYTPNNAIQTIIGIIVLVIVSEVSFITGLNLLLRN
jgi:hypothetical protein